MNDALKHGLEVYGQLRGTERMEQMKDLLESDRFDASMTALSMDFVFGRVWARDGLDRRARSLVTLGILIALRQCDELQNHVRIALTNGLTPKELEEVIVQATAYAGFPAARAAGNAVIQVLDTLNGSTNHRGILSEDE